MPREHLYNLLSSEHTEIDDIISKLENKEIIGENPTRHWDRNKIVCTLEVKDSNFRIQNKKLESTYESIQENEMHIIELLKL